MTHSNMRTAVLCLISSGVALSIWCVSDKKTGLPINEATIGNVEFVNVLKTTD